MLNVFSELNQQGQRLATLHSGASLETLSSNGDFTQVRLPDGVTGWVKSSYLTSQIPATARVKQLEEELDRTRSTTPGLAEAAARSELERLRGELDRSRGDRTVVRLGELLHRLRRRVARHDQHGVVAGHAAKGQ